MARLVSMSSGEVIQVTEGESSIGRGPLLKVFKLLCVCHMAVASLFDFQLTVCPWYCLD